MKNAIIYGFFLLAPPALPAQSGSTGTPPPAPTPNTEQSADTARAIARQLTSKYALDGAQATKVYNIQRLKMKKMAQIAPLQTSDPKLYYYKLDAIQKSTQASIRRLLTTTEQRQMFLATQVQQRKLRAEKQRELQARGASAIEIEAAVTTIYLE
ncbi:MAG: hypothetical protein JNK89_02375 [Saprospiraceae bacterium]|nr:hypothetical protein [Saprospiraceae bacterium]